MTIHFTTAAKMGAGAILTGMAVRYLGVSHPVTIAGLTVMGQALAWMPDFVSRCLRAVRKPERPMPTLSTMPKDMLVEVQKHLPRRDIENLALVDKAQLRAKNPYAAAYHRFADKVREGKPIFIGEIREIIAFNGPLAPFRTKPIELDLSNSNITDAELQGIIARFPNINKINASVCLYLTDAGLQHLAGLTNLEKLNLSWSPISDAGLQHLAGLSNLKELDLRTGWSISDAGLLHLAGLTKLEKLGLAHCVRITGVGLQQHLAGLTNLKKLHLTEGFLDDDELQYLAGLTNLKELNLSDNRINGIGLQHLAGLSKLKKLNLTRCPITNAGLQHLAGLSELEKVYLSECPITDTGLQHLAGLSELEKVYLTRCPITDAGLQHLAGLSQLEKLDLTWCVRITDAGLQHLAGLSQLEKLDLTWCDRITDAGLQSLRGLTKLRKLGRHGCHRITPAGLASLVHYLPNLTISP